MELGWPFPRRKRFLTELKSEQGRPTYGLRFQGKFEHFPIYQVPIGMPKYRLENGRTISAQAAFLAANEEYPKDFFNDPESDGAIEVQHQLLKEMIPEAGLDRYFQRHEQEEPLILSNDGYVINGNRRLCAMRELFEEDPIAHAHFSHVFIVVLPPAQSKDIDELEAERQVHQDIKSDYSWTAFALMLKKRKQDHGYTDQMLAQLYEIRVAAVREYLEMIEDADIYLSSRAKTGQYQIVNDNAYAFRQLRKSRAKLESEEMKDVYQNLCFRLIDDPHGGRLYEMIPDTAKYLDRILEELQDEFEITDPEKDDGYSDLLGRFPRGKVERLVSKLDDDTMADDIRDIIGDVVTSERQKATERRRKNYVLSQLQRANSALADAHSGITEETSKTGISNQLDEISRTIDKIRAWLDE